MGVLPRRFWAQHGMEHKKIGEKPGARRRENGFLAPCTKPFSSFSPRCVYALRPDSQAKRLAWKTTYFYTAFNSGFLMAQWVLTFYLEIGLTLFMAMVFCYPSVLALPSKRGINGYRWNCSGNSDKKPSMYWPPNKRKQQCCTEILNKRHFP